ncbi:hypothetical protein C8Q76DRAFT_608937 [Earliella scabrosa]|nr:hypothetical protein C8Q76DRAFT_608937 [Earliella scabrosa]
MSSQGYPSAPLLPSLVVDVCIKILDLLDVDALVRLRLTSHTADQYVAYHLLVRIAAVLQIGPDQLMRTLVDYYTFVGGSSSIPFFLGDGAIRPRNLDLFVPRRYYSRLIFHLLHRQGAWLEGETSPEDMEGQGLEQRALSGIAWLRSPLGQIVVFRSATHTALSPIVRGYTTAVMNFVHPRYFGCAYRELMFMRRALIADDDRHQHEYIPRYEAAGFEVRLATSLWPDLNHPRCAAAHGCCPVQAHTFTDPHSILARVSPIADAPLNPRVTWRLDLRPCGGPCARHNVLRAWELHRLT